jgi:hypothetical protein
MSSWQATAATSPRYSAPAEVQQSAPRISWRGSRSLVKRCRQALAPLASGLLAFAAIVAPVGAQSTPHSLELAGLTWDHAGLSYSLQADPDVPARALTEVRAAIREWDARLSQLGGAYASLRLVPTAGPGAEIPIVVRAQAAAPAGSAHAAPAYQTAGCWLLRAPVVVSVADERGAALPDDAVFTTTAHELGHALGLGHAATGDDLMAARPTDERRRPSPLDLRGVRAAFAWLEGDNASPGTPRCPRVRGVS